MTTAVLLRSGMMGNYHVPFWRAVEGATPSLTLIIRAEGIRMLKADGSAVSAVGGGVRPKMGRKSHLWHSPVSTEAPTITSV